jgi:putative hydrolase of the HAD superfamily
MIRKILFDLDDTLYPRQAGIMNQIRTLMLRYMQARLELSLEEADALRHHYLLTYGTTMRGLQINHQIDPDEFLHYVHDIPLDQYLRSNPELDSALASIPQEKIIFTNASREHAEHVLQHLGIRHHFSRIVDIRDMDYESKPQALAYRRICEILDVQPGECLLVEDNVRNLQPAKALGMTTVLVGHHQESTDGSVDYALRRIEEIGDLMVHASRQDGTPSSP